MTNNQKAAVAMISFSEYFCDARVKNYGDSLTDNGFLVDVYSIKGSNKESAKGCRDIQIFGPKKRYRGKHKTILMISYMVFFLRTFLAINFRHLFRRYRLIHIHNIPNFLIFTVIFLKICGVKIILDMHDNMPELYMLQRKGKANMFIYRALLIEQSACSRIADIIVSPTELQKKVLIDHGIAEDKIKVVMNCANKKYFNFRKSNARSSVLNFIYHGLIADRTGISTIIRALHIVREKGVKFHFKLIGEGESTQSIIELIHTLKLDKHVTCSGFIPIEKIGQIISEADFGLLGYTGDTDLYKTYMLPVKLLEYSFTGIPCVVPRLASILEYFDEDMTIYYAPDDYRDMSRKIVSASKDSRLMVDLSSNLDRFNQIHNWENYSKKYIDIIRSMGINDVAR